MADTEAAIDGTRKETTMVKDGRKRTVYAVFVGVAIIALGWPVEPPFQRPAPRAASAEGVERKEPPASPTSSSTSPTKTSPGPASLTPADLAAMLPRKDFVLVNVHVPYLGEIPGTDVLLAYDRIEASLDRLPARKSTPVVVYCRSGAMSAIAARTLVRLGYTNVRDLSGGMAAWTEAGYQLAVRNR
jgi:rhodanese-related sulfurtransferase